MIHKSKFIKAQGLPINVVVMMIIGIIIFGLGMGLFSKMSGAGNEEIENLNAQIKNDIASLECDGDDWICSPSNVIDNGDIKTFLIYIANRGEDTSDFEIEITDKSDSKLDGKKGIWKDECGGVIITYPDITTSIMSGHSASIPFVVKATRVKKSCSFVTTATITDVTSSPNKVYKTPIIIRVK